MKESSAGAAFSECETEREAVRREPAASLLVYRIACRLYGAETALRVATDHLR